MTQKGSMVRGLYTHHKVCKDRKEFANYDGSKERSSLTDTEDETPLVPLRCFMNGDLYVRRRRKRFRLSGGHDPRVGMDRGRPMRDVPNRDDR